MFGAPGLWSGGMCRSVLVGVKPKDNVKNSLLARDPPLAARIAWRALWARCNANNCWNLVLLAWRITLSLSFCFYFLYLCIFFVYLLSWAAQHMHIACRNRSMTYRSLFFYFCFFKEWPSCYFWTCSLPGSFNESGHSLLTSLINTAFSPTELSAAWCFLFIVSSYVNSRHSSVWKSPESWPFLRSWKYHVWHQQLYHV